MLRSAKRRLIVTSGAVLAGVLIVAAVVAAQGGPEAPADLRKAIESEPLVKVLDLPSAEGAGARSMFVQPTSAGFLCVWDAPSASSKARQGGCNPSDDPLAGRAVSASLAYEGGPAADSVKDARLIGLATAETEAVHVVMNDGSVRELRVKSARVGVDTFRAFGYRFKTADLKKGLGPTMIVALDAKGAEIGRQPTGFGG